MKNSIFLKVLSFVCLVGLPLQSWAQEKKALLITISKFADPHWKPLGSLNDRDVMLDLLVKQGFEKANIQVLADQAATHEGIKATFMKFTETLQPGDIAVIQFSTHGVQVEDLNDDENDLLDEAVVCYDSPNEFIEGGFLIDEEIGELIYQVRAKLRSKGDLLVLMDLCHSGSATRGGQDMVARGGYPPLVSKSFDGSKAKPDEPENKYAAATSRGGDDVNLSPHTIYAASQAHQLDYERRMSDGTSRSLGALTYAVYKCLRNNAEQLTYEGLFGKISSVIQEVNDNNGQLPSMDGDLNKANRLIFGGTFVKQEPWYVVNNISGDGTSITIEAGELVGMTIGSEVSVCATATTVPDKNNTLSVGKVISMDAFTAQVKLETPLVKKQPAQVWAFITKKALNPEIVRVDFAKKTARGMADVIEMDAKMQKSIRSSLTDTKGVEWGAPADLLLSQQKDSIQIWINSTGRLMTTCHANQLATQLDNYAKYRAMKKLDIGNLSEAVTIEIKPFKDGDMNNVTNNGVTVIKIDDVKIYSVYVTNRTNQNLYMNAVYLAPDGKMTCFFPAKNLTADDCLLIPNKPTQTFSFRVNTADGLETFKIILSPVKIDMRRALNKTTTASRGGGDLTVLENIFGSLNESTRGATNETIPKSSGIIGTFSFESIE